jgi:hypothetical protein
MVRSPVQFRERKAEVQCWLCMLLAHRDLRVEKKGASSYTNAFAGVIQNPPIDNLRVGNGDDIQWEDTYHRFPWGRCKQSVNVRPEMLSRDWDSSERKAQMLHVRACRRLGKVDCVLEHPAVMTVHGFWSSPKPEPVRNPLEIICLFERVCSVISSQSMTMLSDFLKRLRGLADFFPSLPCLARPCSPSVIVSLASKP